MGKARIEKVKNAWRLGKELSFPPPFPILRVLFSSRSVLSESLEQLHVEPFSSRPESGGSKSPFSFIALDFNFSL